MPGEIAGTKQFHIERLSTSLMEYHALTLEYYENVEIDIWVTLPSLSALMELLP
jgi:hypothetical protein